MNWYESEVAAAGDGCRWCVDVGRGVVGTADDGEMRRWLSERGYRKRGEQDDVMPDYEIMKGEGR